MARVLDQILAAKNAEIEVLRRQGSPKTTTFPHAPLAMIDALARTQGQSLRLITEIKRRSPSAGALSTKLSVAERALVYARGGAAMISVLCDSPFFDGSFAHLREAREAINAAGLKTPLLAKEFVLDETQIDEARAHGADSVLLIARIVTHDRLRELVAKSRSVGLEPLVEVIDEDELSAAIDADAKIIGVNARDLDTLEMDAARAARVLAAIPDDRVRAHLSGLKTSEDVAHVARTEADAALMGEALMRMDDPTELLSAFVKAAG
jgi:indole-3-glycerol phosphate synthase